MADMTNKILSVQLEATSAINGIVRLNEAIEANNKQLALNKKEIDKQSEAMKKGGEKGLQAAENVKKLKQANAELEAQTKELTAEKRVLQKETQNEIKMQSQEEGSLKALRAELSKLTNQYDSLSKAERENSEAGKQLQRDINRVTTEIKNAEMSTQRYYRNVGNYQNAIMQAIGLNGQFGTSIMNIVNVQGGVQGAFTAMGQSVKAFGSTLMGLLTNPVFLALAGIAGVGMAFKWFYDYNEGLAEANRLTREFTGYTGNDLVAMRNSIQATSDVMGKDFKETLQTADTLMAQFHMTGEQAMEVINKGFAAGADVNGDFLSKAQQLAPTFHDAGISADQMVAIISQTRSGIFSDQGLEAIKQGSARIREMSTTTRQALQGIGIDVDEMENKLRSGQMGTFDAIKQVSSALKELPDNAQEVGEVMSAVFGRQGKFASQEMIESIAEMSTSLDDVMGKTGEYGDLLLENIQTEEELDNVTSAIFDMTNKGWEEAKQKAIIYAKQALVAVVKGLVDVINWFIRLYNQSLIVRGGVQSIIASFNAMWQAVKFVFNTIVNAVKSMGRAFEALANVIEGVFSLDAQKVYNGWRKAENAFKEGWNTLKKDAIKAGTDTASGFADAYNATLNGQIDEFAIPAFSGISGTGGGGGGGGTAPTRPSGGGKSKGGGRSRSGGSSSSGGSGGKTPEQQELERLKQYMAERKRLAGQLAKEAQAIEKAALQEQAKVSIDGINALYDAQEKEIKDKYKDLGLLTLEEQVQLDALIKQNNEKRKAAIEKYEQDQAKAQMEARKKAQDQAKQLAQASADASPDASELQLKWRLEVLRMEMEAELAMVEKNEQLKAAIRAKYDAQATQMQKEWADKQVAIEQEKYTALASVSGALGELAGAFGEENKEMAIMSKTLALGEIMIAQAVAIANAVKAGSNALSPWQLIAQIATSVVAVTTAMAQAFAALDSAKFATGGYIRGAGTSTSDSIPIRVSNGEAVMNAQTTAMFGGLLSSLNQLGGGVPIQAQQTASSVRGEDMLARAVARGVAMLPAPVVSVQDINRGQRQVEVMTERARL